MSHAARFSRPVSSGIQGANAAHTLHPRPLDQRINLPVQSHHRGRPSQRQQPQPCRTSPKQAARAAGTHQDNLSTPSNFFIDESRWRHNDDTQSRAYLRRRMRTSDDSLMEDACDSEPSPHQTSLATPQQSEKHTDPTPMDVEEKYDPRTGRHFKPKPTFPAHYRARKLDKREEEFLARYERAMRQPRSLADVFAGRFDFRSTDDDVEMTMRSSEEEGAMDLD